MRPSMFLEHQVRIWSLVEGQPPVVNRYKEPQVRQDYLSS